MRYVLLSFSIVLIASLLIFDGCADYEIDPCAKDGLITCFGDCVDLENDDRHCGLCGNACIENAYCAYGKCRCIMGYTDCSGTCTNLNRDRKNCGYCGNECDSGKDCVYRVCSSELRCSEDADCVDGNSCTVEDRCVSGVCRYENRDCSYLEDQCNDSICDFATEECISFPKPDGAPCDDGDCFTFMDGCYEGICTGMPYEIDCFNECSTAACDPDTDEPACIPRGGSICNDDDPCTYADVCSEIGICAGTPYSCDDENICTDDLCDGAGDCSYQYNTGPCDDGNHCTHNDSCVNGVCVGCCDECDDGNVCTDASYDPETCECLFVPKEGPCDDGDPCTYPDTCIGTSCVGTDRRIVPVEQGGCDDGICCTIDSCDPATGNCSNTPDSQLCPPDPCDGGDVCRECVCDPGAAFPPCPWCSGELECSGCVYVGPDCNDNNVCTNDSLNPVDCSCVHVFNTSLCDDGDDCTVDDQCDGGVCTGGPAVELCDGIDNDCDGQTDEDFDFQTDNNHCGVCNNVCDVAIGSICQGGSCSCIPDCTGLECGSGGCADQPFYCGQCPGGSWCDNGVCEEFTAEPVWVSIPGGTFMMGSDSISYAQPVHQVTVPSFEMTMTEVTLDQYQACVDATVCLEPFTQCGSSECNWGQYGYWDHPVNCVTWYRATSYCTWIGGRLPTEAEWEYAARSAGQDIEYPWGDETATCDYAVMNDGDSGCGTDHTWQVCSKKAGNTDQGLCDMAGNVMEWVEDWWHLDYNGAPSDGSAWEEPINNERVERGGNYRGTPGRLIVQAARRYSNVNTHYSCLTGIRCVRDVPP